MDKTRAQKLTQEWMLEYDLMEKDSSMLTDTCYNWKAIIENFRVRGIDTTELTNEQNGISGISIPGGNYIPISGWKLPNWTHSLVKLPPKVLKKHVLS